MNKKKVLAVVLAVNATIIVITIIIISAIICANKLKTKQEQEYIDICISVIDNDYSNFENEENRVEKLEKLKNLSEEFNNYKQFREIKTEITEEYENKIKSMKNYFISDYDSKIAEYTLENLNEITDKEVLNNTKKSLEDLLETINSEYEAVLTESQFESYKKTVNNLISSYNSKITEIEEVEKAEAEKTEAEKLAAEKKKEENKKNNNSSSDKKENSNSNNSKQKLEYVVLKDNNTGEIMFEGYLDVSHKQPGWRICLYINEDGEKFFHYADNYGHVYDMEGNDITW